MGRRLAKYFVSLSSAVCILLLSAMGAYGLTRFRFKAWPEQMALVPPYKLLQSLGIYNIYIAAILPDVAFRIPSPSF